MGSHVSLISHVSSIAKCHTVPVPFECGPGGPCVVVDAAISLAASFSHCIFADMGVKPLGPDSFTLAGGTAAVSLVSVCARHRARPAAGGAGAPAGRVARRAARPRRHPLGGSPRRAPPTPPAAAGRERATRAGGAGRRPCTPPRPLARPPATPGGAGRPALGLAHSRRRCNSRCTTRWQ